MVSEAGAGALGSQDRSPSEVRRRPGGGIGPRLLFPARVLPRLLAGAGLAFDSSGSTQTTSVDGLAGRAISWGAIGGLTYRVTLGPTLFTGALATVRRQIPMELFVAVLVILAGDLALLTGLVAGRLRWLLRSRTFFAADVLITMMVNLWAAASLPLGTFFLPGRDFLWGYAFGTMALWTCLRGPRTGGLLLAGGAALMLLMARLNHAPLTFSGWMEYASRMTLLAVAFVLPVAFVAMARRSAQLAVGTALRAGRAEERAETLRVLHDTVLQTLGAIVLHTAVEEGAPERLAAVHTIARRQHLELRQALTEDDEHARGDLAGRLAGIAQEFRRLGLDVELVTAELDTVLPAPVNQALIRATREALTNVRSHAGVDRAIVRAASALGGVQIVIRDHGCGFDMRAPAIGYGLEHSIRRRLEQVGASAQIWSAPGRGTRVRLQWRPQ